jgi:gamma-D-glutamyl-L-lysine dipeptidyl-peptidase
MAVAGGGLTAAATTGSSVAPLADSTVAAPATTASPSTTAAATAPVAPAAVRMWVRVPAANVWYKVGWVRRIDRPSLGATPNLAKWVANQSYSRRLELGINLMTEALRGEQVTLLSTYGSWAHVRVDAQRGNFYRLGIIGWIWKSQLSASPVPAATVTQLPRRGSSIIHAARAYLGTTYIFGGMTHAGIDCSGLTYLAAQHVGVQLPRDAADQSRVGAVVRRKDLRPGDLVFFGPGSRDSIHHVAIYIGAGRVLHAPHTGSWVRITRLSTFHDYWGARRLVPVG